MPEKIIKEIKDNETARRGWNFQLSQKSSKFLESILVVLFSFSLILALYITNQNLFFLNFFDPPWFDPFLYWSLFQSPFKYIAAHPDYYPATRIPFIFLGAIFYSILSPEFANVVFKIFIASSTLALFCTIARNLFGTIPALVSTLLLGTYPYFIATIGWDYVDLGALFFIALIYFGVVRGYTHADNKAGEVLIGAILPLLVWTHLYAVVIVIAALGLYAVLRCFHNPSVTNYLKSASHIVAGLIGSVILASIVTGLLNGDFFFFETQLSTAASLSGQSEWSFDKWSYLLPVATWLSLPISIGIISLVITLWRILSRGIESKFLTFYAVAVHFIALLAVFTWTTLTSVAVFSFWFYCSFLLIPCFLTLAGILAPLQKNSGSTFKTAALITISFVLLVLFYSDHILSAFSKFAQATTPMPSDIKLMTCAMLAAIACVGISARLQSWIMLLSGILIIGLIYQLMSFGSNSSQLHRQSGQSRSDAFNVVHSAVQEIKSCNDGTNTYLWIDREEMPNGPIYHGISIASLMSNRDIDIKPEPRFPNLPSNIFKTGDRIVIMSSRPDLNSAAKNSLNSQQMGLKIERAVHIARGSISFDLVCGSIEHR